MMFTKEYKNCPLPDNEHLNLTYVESKGNTVEELLGNALISLEDWYGNQGPDWELSDLPDSIIKMVEEDMQTHIIAQAIMQDEVL